MNYDNWKLDNREDDWCACDKCGDRSNDRASFLGMGVFDVICNNCADDMKECECCCRIGESEDFSYGENICNNCVDLNIDKVMDND